jgi:hypothetical protein
MVSLNLTKLASTVKGKTSCIELFKELFPGHYQGRSSQCPFHDDKRNSLEVHEDHLFCHAGCKPPSGKKSWDVIDLWMKAKGVDFPTAVRELGERCGITIEPAPTTDRRIVATYDYTDENGKLLFQVLRYNPKDFRQRRPDPAAKDGWKWSLSDTRRVLFNLARIINAPAGDPLLILEGEKDCETAVTLGFTATTSPGGAGKWESLCEKFNIHEPLRGRVVWIVPDNDEPGRKHAAGIAQSLVGHAKSVKILNLPDLPEKGDVSDFIAMHSPDEARRLLLKLAAATPEHEQQGPRVGHLVTFDGLMKMDLPKPRMTVEEFISEGLAVLAGAPKIGKSWWAMELAIAVATGGLFLGRFRCNRGSVLYLGLEDNQRRFKSRLEKQLGNDPCPDNAYFASEWPPFSDQDSDQPDGLCRIHQWLETHHETCRLVVVDTLSKVRKRRGKSDDLYDRDYRDLEGLQRLAAQYAVTILVVHHLNKGAHADEFNSISGTTGITGCADSVLILTKPRTETEGKLFVSGRDIEEKRGVLHFDRETGLWSWTGDETDVKVSQAREEILCALRAADKPLSISEITELCETKRSKGAVQKSLSRMFDEGQVDKAVGQSGKYLVPPRNGSPEPPLPRWSDAPERGVHLEHL